MAWPTRLVCGDGNGILRWYRIWSRRTTAIQGHTSMLAQTERRSASAAARLDGETERTGASENHVIGLGKVLRHSFLPENARSSCPLTSSRTPHCHRHHRTTPVSRPWKSLIQIHKRLSTPVRRAKVVWVALNRPTASQPIAALVVNVFPGA